ncbi:alpha-amylase [bacterium]|nr:MAG: alpha-amylase [bacterium]
MKIQTQSLFARCGRILGAAATLVSVPSAYAQGGYNDPRVMIQGFGWESHQDGRMRSASGVEYEVHWRHKWYDYVNSKVDELAAAKFDVIWLPPPSQGEGAGYHPEQYFNFANNYGTDAQQRRLLRALLNKGIEPIADIVINHRNGSGGWATYKNPTWPSSFICSTDEFWKKALSDLPNPRDRAILQAGKKGAPDSGADWEGARDLGHSNPALRAEIKKYLGLLKKLGYRGWRYDMAKGFDPRYIAEYNYASKPSFAVGEYWDDNAAAVTSWVDGTKWQGQSDPALKACPAFDFPTKNKLATYLNNSQYDHLPALSFHDGVNDGLIAINRNKAVTFLENHDTGFPQKAEDSFKRNEKLMQGYAYILTHPGIPCVYWKHYFDWQYGPQIKALIRARKYARVNSGSYMKTEVHGNNYVAIIGDKPTESSTLIVKIGQGLEFNPDSRVWKLETWGDGYAVWVRK